MIVHAYEVGKPYDPRRRHWGQTVDYNFRGREHELRLFIPSPTRHEFEAVRSGEAEFALWIEPPHLIVLCYRFGAARGVPWSDAPFSWHRMVAQLPPEEHVLPIGWEEGSPETRALLQVILVDGDTGIVRALRALTFSPEFTRAIHKAIWEQAHAPADDTAYQRAYQELCQRYQSDALARACPIRHNGGA